MNFLLNLYQTLLEAAAPALELLLKRRLAHGKEDAVRIGERKGQTNLRRPAGRLIWLHGASVGEAQSTLILIEQLRARFPDTTILLTTGTVTSAHFMAQRLPAGVIHQYYPVDRPGWVNSFLAHWQPDFVLWMESELWPAMMCALQERKVPAILLNARMSPRSLSRWQIAPGTVSFLLQSFTKILTQTETDAQSFRALGATSVRVSGNLKYAAAALPVNESDLETLRQAAGNRPRWVYASTHKGEEELACRLHKTLAQDIPGLLTIIVPRHPERRADIVNSCRGLGVSLQLRSADKTPPETGTDIYIADTLGELGLFYRFAPVACIGRSFSNDGGGGHNPIEAAQLGCAVLHGPHIQNLRAIYHDMGQALAVREVHDENDFAKTLKIMLTDFPQREKLSRAGLEFISTQHDILNQVIADIVPVAETALHQKAHTP